MRFGLCASDPDVIKQLPAWGYDYAEIGARALVPFESDRVFAAAKARLLDGGTPIEALAGFIPGTVRVVGPEVDWEAVRGYLETTVGRAAEVGVKVINWGSAESRRVPAGWSTSRAWEQLERVAGIIADIAARSDIVVAIEPVNPREANILFYVDEAIQLAQTINRSSLRVNVDYYHVFKQNEPIERVAQAGAWIAHSHTSDDERRFPCLGGWDQRPFLDALLAAGYDGRLSFEVSKADKSTFAADAALSVRRLRELQDVVTKSRGPAAGP